MSRRLPHHRWPARVREAEAIVLHAITALHKPEVYRLNESQVQTRKLESGLFWGHVKFYLVVAVMRPKATPDSPDWQSVWELLVDCQLPQEDVAFTEFRSGPDWWRVETSCEDGHPNSSELIDSIVHQQASS